MEKQRNVLNKYEPPDDILEEIFRLQRLFGSKFCDFDKQDIRYVMKWSEVFLECIDQEKSELRDWLPWKHWKNYENFELDEEEIRFEIIDMLHFTLSHAMVNKISAQDVYRYFDVDHFQDLLDVISFDIEIGDKIKYTRNFLLYLNGHLTYPSDSINLLEMNLELCIVWDMDAWDIYNYYRSKNEENFNRQARGY